MEGGKVVDLFARFSPASSAEEGRAFFQQRLALFAKVLSLTYAALLVYVKLLYGVYPRYRPIHFDIVYYVGIAGLGIQVLVWRAASGRKVLPGRTLMAFDALCIVLTASVFTVAGTLSDGNAVNIYTAFAWMSFAVFARSLFLPSTALRTALLSALCLCPALAAAFAVELSISTEYLFAGATVLSSFVIVLATIGSAVIYNLREQVTEAQQLGQYTLLEKIGEGGMGAVFRARHTMLRRPTAIKLVRPELVDADSVARFEREVQATAKLTHPNTVAVFDYGRSPEGAFYYAMEYLDGVDLETLVRTSGYQPWRRVVHILAQICGALEEAHRRRLVHRDIKPGNVIVCNRAGLRDFAKVLDFGLVREITTGDRLSKGDIVAGTPAYLAPEAVTDPDKVGPASDLYAVGAVGYFLLTGQVLFTGSTVLEVCVHHVRTEPTPPSRRTDNEIPRGLEELLLQCLRKDPADRPSSARELRLALERIGSGGRWTERQAIDWWATFEAAHGHELPRAQPSSLESVTIDLAGRTGELLSSAARGDGVD